MTVEERLKLMEAIMKRSAGVPVHIATAIAACALITAALSCSTGGPVSMTDSEKGRITTFTFDCATNRLKKTVK